MSMPVCDNESKFECMYPFSVFVPINILEDVYVSVFFWGYINMYIKLLLIDPSKQTNQQLIGKPSKM